MAHSHDGAGKRRYWEEAVARRCDDEWREACIKYDKGWSKKQHEMEAASHSTSNVLGTTVYATARGCLVPESQDLQVLDGVALLDKGTGTSLARDAEFETS